MPHSHWSHPTRPRLNRAVPTLALLGSLAAVATVGCSAPEADAAAANTPPPVSRTVVASAPSAAPADSVRDALVARADAGRIHGSKEAVWVVVISDFECPYCKRWHEETGTRIDREYVRTGKVQIAYVNYPISNIHPAASAAHETAMCASEQGKFWPIADALFASQENWKGRRDAAPYFDTVASRQKLDMPRYRTCIREGAVRALIDADVDRSIRAGAGSTPTFLIGGRLVVGAQPYEVFKRAIDDAIAAARSAAKP